jgi:hypothetical protein
MAVDLLFQFLTTVAGITFADKLDRIRKYRLQHPREVGRRRNIIRRRLGMREKLHRQRMPVDLDNLRCHDLRCNCHIANDIHHRWQPPPAHMTPEFLHMLACEYLDRTFGPAPEALPIPAVTPPMAAPAFDRLDPAMRYTL